MTQAIAATVNIEMRPVKSSQVHSIGHHEETSTLGVRFLDKHKKPGGLYHYQNVTVAEFMALTMAASIGSYLYKHIKPFPKLFPFSRILESDPVESIVAELEAKAEQKRGLRFGDAFGSRFDGSRPECSSESSQTQTKPTVVIPAKQD